MPAPPSSKQQQSIKSPANTKKSGTGGGFMTGTNYSSKTAPKAGGGSGGGLLGQAQSKGKSGNAPSTQSGGGKISLLSGSLNSGGKSSFQKGATLSPADMLRGGYQNYQQPPSGAFAQTQIPTPINRVSGGNGVQAYSPQGNSYTNEPTFKSGLPFKDQAQVPGKVDPNGYSMMAYGANPANGQGEYTQMAFGQSPTQAPGGGISPMAGQGAPGFGPTSPFANAYNMANVRDAYDRFAMGSAPQGSPAPANGQLDSLYGNDPSQAPSSNPVTNVARKIAAKLSGPLAGADFKLGQMFPGMSAQSQGSLYDGDRFNHVGESGSGMGARSQAAAQPPSGAPLAPPVTPPAPPPPQAQPWFYPQYTSGAFARLPTGQGGMIPGFRL
jgi:hypothetical protein